MLGVGEHVDGLDATDVVGLVEELKVACLGGRVAAYIYYLTRARGEELTNHLLVHAGTRRIGDDDVGTSVEGDKLLGEDFRHVAYEKLGIGYIVDLRVETGVLDGFGHILDADDLAATVGEELGYGAGAGVEVIDRLVAMEVGELVDERIEALGLEGVGLVEGLGVDLEGEVTFSSIFRHLFADVVLAVVEVDGEVGVGVVELGVDDILQRGDLGERVSEVVEEREEESVVGLGDDDEDHPLAEGAATNDEVAEEAGVVADVVEREGVGEGIVAHGEAYGVGEVLLEGAVFDWEDLVEEAGDVKAECAGGVGGVVLDFFPGAGREGEFELVAIVEDIVGAADGLHEAAVHRAEAFEVIAHLPLFGFELVGVVECLPLAAAAYAEMGALLRNPLGRRHAELDQTSLGVGLLLFDKFDVGDVAGYHEGDEDDETVVTGYGFAFGGDILDEEVLYDRLSFHLVELHWREVQLYYQKRSTATAAIPLLLVQ